VALVPAMNQIAKTRYARQNHVRRHLAIHRKVVPRRPRCQARGLLHPDSSMGPMPVGTSSSILILAPDKTLNVSIHWPRYTPASGWGETSPALDGHPRFAGQAVSPERPSMIIEIAATSGDALPHRWRLSEVGRAALLNRPRLEGRGASRPGPIALAP
jgi:hypothetical protein